MRRAHEVGAVVILDAYQSAGIVPLDVTALGVDFAVGGSVKWLCGGPGNGWLYVRPDLAERLEPAYTGWQAHEQPFGFEPEMRYAQGAARFLTGTPNVPALFAATPGYDLIEEIGVDADPRELAPPDRPPDRPRRRGRLRGALAARAPPVAAAPSPCTCPTSRRCTGSSASGRSCATSVRAPGSGSGRTTSTPTRSSSTSIAQIGEILETGAHERWLGAAARF